MGINRGYGSGMGSFEGFGNNPQPVLEDMNDRVCDDCNWNIVIPARIRGYEND